MLKKSNYLQVYEKNGSYLVYHKMFGNLSLLDSTAYNILENIEKVDAGSHNESLILEKLSDNYFIVEGGEELDILETEKKNREHADDGHLLVGLQLVVSNFCNFGCKYCFLDKAHKLRDNSDSNAHSNMKYEVAEASINNMIENLKKNQNTVLSIEFFGGEPLMNWPLLKKVFDTYKSGEDYGIAIYYTITTNGSLLTEEMMNYFRDYHVSVIISYDSPSSRERLTNTGKELNEVIEPLLCKLDEKGVTVSFNSVISRYTIKTYDYIGLVDMAARYHVQNIGLILDLDADFITEGYTNDDIVNIILETYDYGKESGIHVTGYWAKMYSQINNEEDLYFTKGYKACPATGCKVSVEPSGDIFACKCCTQKIGELDKFDDLLGSSKYKAYLDKVYLNGDGCESCELQSFCSGVCVGALEKKGSMYGRNENLCYIYRKVTRELIDRTDEAEISTVIKSNADVAERDFAMN